jgi:transcriptional regulator with XRE-family HTH domain
MSSDDMGTRLRAAREKTGLSLRSVASAIGVSPSLLSQVETGKTNPSVSTLYDLVTHLGISTDELLGLAAPAAATSPAKATSGMLEANSAVIVQHAADNPVLIMENGVRWERLASAAGGAADPLLVTYEPGASSSVEGHMMRHYGREHAIILEGELTLQIEFDTHVLRAGDSLFFDSIRPHLYVNHSDKPARGVWFVIGRREGNENLGPGLAQPARTPTSPTSAVEVMQAWD